jgi:hypothetical protein
MSQVTVTPCNFPFNTIKGKATARFMIDYGAEDNLMWVCFLKKNGECWCFQNKDIRMEPNFSLRDQEKFEGFNDETHQLKG